MDDDMLCDEISYVLNDYVGDVDEDDIESVYELLKDTDVRDDECMDTIIRETYDMLKQRKEDK